MFWLLKLFIRLMYRKFLKPSDYKHLYIRFKNVKHRFSKSFMHYLLSYKGLNIICLEEVSAIGYNGVRPQKSKRR